MMLRMMRFLIRALAILICLPLAALALYTAAACVALLLAPEQRAPEDGILIYACDNGVHTDLVVPVAAAGTDWRTLFRPEAFAGPIEGYHYIGIGWGSRNIYLHTPTWADVDIATSVRSVLWDETVLRIDYRPRPSAAETCGAWVVDQAGYDRIASFIKESLRLSQGLPVQAGPGYGKQDAFYVANGRYTIIQTCNQWTRDALALGNAPVAPWTPYSFLVLWNLPMISK